MTTNEYNLAYLASLARGGSGPGGIDPTPPPPADVLDRILGLIIVRESDMYDTQLFDGMREQTLAQLAHIPAIAAVRACGLAPMKAKNGSFTLIEQTPDGPVKHKITVRVIRRGRTTAYLFGFKGYFHLWCMGSAASSDENGLNDFTSIACELFVELKPYAVYVANISRLIRSLRHALDLEKALLDNVDYLWLGTGGSFPLTGPGSAMGFMMLKVLGLVAAMERDWIVQRTVTGKIWRATQKWPFPHLIPFGYTLSEDGTLIPDPDLAPQVMRMLMVLCSDAPATEIALRLGEIGVTTMREIPRLGKKATVDRLSNPSALLVQLYRWVPLYTDGEYLLRIKNPVPHVDQLGGIPIVKNDTDPKDLGEVQIMLTAALPEGGWAPDEVLDALRLKTIAFFEQQLEHTDKASRPLGAHVLGATRCSNPRLHAVRLFHGDARRGGAERAGMTPEQYKERQRRMSAAASKQIVAPLAGRTWSDGEFRYELSSVKAGLYRLLRWPISQERRPVHHAKLHQGKYPRKRRS